MTDSFHHPLDRQAAAIFEACWISPEAAALRTPGIKAGDYLSLLSARDLYKDAVQCLAFAMPNRQAVWWLCQVLWHQRDTYFSDLEQAALRTAVQWVVHPTPANVAAARKASHDAPFDSAARCAASAAAAAGSGPLTDDPALATTNQRMAAQLVAGALSLAFGAATTAGADLSWKQILVMGYDVVRGVSRWDTILAAHAISHTTK